MLTGEQIERLKVVYDSLFQKKACLNTVPFDVFIKILNNFHVAFLEDNGYHGGDYPTDVPFEMYVVETSIASLDEMERIINIYLKKEQEYDKSRGYEGDSQSCEYAQIDDEEGPCEVIVSSHPFETRKEIEVTMTHGRKILCVGHPDTFYLDNFYNVYHFMKEACPDIL